MKEHLMPDADMQAAGERYWGKPKERAAFEEGARWGLRKARQPAAPSSFVNGADIRATDSPGDVVRKLDAAHARAMNLVRLSGDAQPIKATHADQRFYPMNFQLIAKQAQAVQLTDLDSIDGIEKMIHAAFEAHPEITAFVTEGVLRHIKIKLHGTTYMPDAGDWTVIRRTDRLVIDTLRDAQFKETYEPAGAGDSL